MITYGLQFGIKKKLRVLSKGWDILYGRCMTQYKMHEYCKVSIFFREVTQNFCLELFLQKIGIKPCKLKVHIMQNTQESRTVCTKTATSAQMSPFCTIECFYIFRNIALYIHFWPTMHYVKTAVVTITKGWWSSQCAFCILLRSASALSRPPVTTLVKG